MINNIKKKISPNSTTNLIDFESRENYKEKALNIRREIMEQMKKLESSINRSIYTPIRGLQVFLDILPINYLEWLESNCTVRKRELARDCEDALKALVLLANRLNAFRADVLCVDGSHRLRMNHDGNFYIDYQSDTVTLWEETLNFTLEDSRTNKSR